LASRWTPQDCLNWEADLSAGSIRNSRKYDAATAEIKQEGAGIERQVAGMGGSRKLFSLAPSDSRADRVASGRSVLDPRQRLRTPEPKRTQRTRTSAPTTASGSRRAPSPINSSTAAVAPSSSSTHAGRSVQPGLRNTASTASRAIEPRFALDRRLTRPGIHRPRANRAAGRTDPTTPNSVTSCWMRR
jgi:hypothetical protein